VPSRRSKRHCHESVAAGEFLLSKFIIDKVDEESYISLLTTWLGAIDFGK
jgi:hypothetical protein